MYPHIPNKITNDKTVLELLQNWKDILFNRNHVELNNIPLSDDEMERVLDVVKLEGNTPVKANQMINGKLGVHGSQ